MITTSYFAKLKHIPNPVAITQGVPQFYNGPNYKKLAPSKDLLFAYKGGKITEEEYSQVFVADVLMPLDPEQTYAEIVRNWGDDAVLLCWEKSCDFCHRHLVSGWFDLHGYPVRELSFDNLLK
jgi:hypothetical protein